MSLALILLRCGGPMSKINIKDQLEQSDAFFLEGKFTEAEKEYKKVLKEDSQNLKALMQGGNIALLSNRFKEAESFLKQALHLAPENPSLKSLLAEVYYRMDDFPVAAPLFREIGREVVAKKLESFQTTNPYQLEGPKETRLKFFMTDPLPVVKVSINDSKPVNFFIDTGGAELILDSEFVKEVGVIDFGSEPVSPEIQLGHGLVETLTLGEFTIKNVPIHILNTRQYNEIFGGMRIDGVIGTVFLYHFLATINYPGAELILRRQSREVLKNFEQMAAKRKDISVPFWMAGDHFIVAWGTVNNSSPMLFFVDTGLARKAFTAPESTLKEADIHPDISKASEGLTIYGKEKHIPFTIAELTLGEAAEKNLDGSTMNFQVEYIFGFRIGGLISHQFFRKYALTLDFTGMRLFLEPKEKQAR